MNDVLHNEVACDRDDDDICIEYFVPAFSLSSSKPLTFTFTVCIRLGGYIIMKTGMHVLFKHNNTEVLETVLQYCACQLASINYQCHALLVNLYNLYYGQ